MTNNILPKLIGNFKNYILIGFIAIFATSCYSVTTSSYSDREFKEKKYNKICIYSYDKNLVYRSLLEEMMVEELQLLNVEAIEGSELFPPTKERDENEFQSDLLANNVDGFLKFEVVYDNINNYPEESEFELNKYYQNDINSNLRYRFSVHLIDVKTNKIAWVGSSEPINYYEINQFNRDGFFWKFSRSVIEELQEKGHIE
ncbi:MAG: hypothetical protein R2863_05040 [Candidatus Kapaibacterium sp.]